ncbi:hypothetical protein IVB36_00170 [Bradyrhizobium sp. 35]|uniref:hypothetical protein n=1 Tax=unclassified Bradyrhizobium TaxID=2631580 RepID=UPI0003A660A4|nr:MULTISPECIES: hypothetical protein [unclassified Bradyrhizobium]MCK1449375.1 hypothetical protein [Bradyrhizobium sp. 35]
MLLHVGVADRIQIVRSKRSGSSTLQNLQHPRQGGRIDNHRRSLSRTITICPLVSVAATAGPTSVARTTRAKPDYSLCGTPKNRKKIDWKLITDLPVGSRTDAIEKLEWYGLRWKIEVFQKILKSGCKAEESKLRPPSL